MKKIIINVLVLILLVSSLQITVIATEKQNYSFDDLIIETNVEFPYLTKEDGFSEGLVAQREDIYYGFYDKMGNMVIPCLYDNVSGINCNMYMLGVTPNFYSLFQPMEKKPGFHEGIACVQKNRRWGAIDKSGNVVVPFEFTK